MQHWRRSLPWSWRRRRSRRWLATDGIMTTAVIWDGTSIVALTTPAAIQVIGAITIMTMMMTAVGTSIMAGAATAATAPAMATAAIRAAYRVMAAEPTMDRATLADKVTMDRASRRTRAS